MTLNEYPSFVVVVVVLFMILILILVQEVLEEGTRTFTIITIEVQ